MKNYYDRKIKEGKAYGVVANAIKFLVCDPTYIGAPIGMTMPSMDNQSAKVIVLN